jgi:multiple sugar transport system substrate-binding protein
MKLINIVAAGVVLAALSSCGGGGSSGPSRAAFGGALRYDPSASVADLKPVSLTFWTQIDQEEIYRKLVDDYMALHPNVKIDLVSSSYQDHFPKLQAALNAGIGPDLFHFHNAFHKELLPFMEPFPQDVLPLEALERDFRQVDAHRIDGKLYYLDTGLMTSAIYYNTKAWSAAGLTAADIPRTWDQLRAVAVKLTLRDQSGAIVQSGFNPNGIGWSIVVAQNLQQGQSMFSLDAEARPLVDTPATRKSLAWLGSLYAPGGPADRRMPEFQESFAQGTSVMIYGWGWVTNWMANHGPEVTYDTFPLPAWSDTVPAAYDRNNGESTPCVNKASSADKKAVAFDLIKFFLASDEYLASLDAKFSLAPSKRSLQAQTAFSRILDRTVWPGLVPVDYENLMTEHLVDPVILDKAAVGGALEDTQKRLFGVLASLGFQSRERDYAHAADFTKNP